MSDARFQRVSDLFLQARRLGLHEREQFLERACDGDVELRREVEQILKAADDALPFAELAEDLRGARQALATESAAAAAAERNGAADPASGSRVGNYKLLEKIGEGGFGTVYVAEQEQPVRRRVALKVIKLGMDTKRVVARFEAERQALAMMDHPHIARVFDAGATDTGRPYFVMELVRGIPITAYCDQNQLSARQRCELFVPVCQAVQHAHTKAVIHRDLKPSNVLVTLHDGQPVPKVIDFGIAKATAGRLTDKTIYTEFHAMIGTPAYMSPEQAELSGLDIDTRSDIYALGVLLYELLTGTTPFDATDLLRSGLAEMQRIIREVEPPKPSTRVSSLSSILPLPPGEGRGEGGSSVLDIAKHRRTDPQSLAKTIRGDLDWVVMKCLEKDRTRRYETANGLAMDIQRHLHDEPVVAGPPSRAYRARKFIRRNKGPVLAGALLAMVLLLGAIGTTIGLIWALRAQRFAQAQLAIADSATRAGEEQRRIAREARAKAAQFLHDSITALASKDSKTPDLQVLEAASALVESGALTDQPELEAAVRDSLGRSYGHLLVFPKAQLHLTRAADLTRRLYGNRSEQLANELHELAAQYYYDGKFAEQEPLERERLAIWRELYGEDHPEVDEARNDLALSLCGQGDYTEAIPLLRQCLAELRRRGDDGGVATGLSNLASALSDTGDFAEAELLG